MNEPQREINMNWKKIQNFFKALNGFNSESVRKKEIKEEIRKIMDNIDRNEEERDQHDRRLMIFYIVKAALIKLLILGTCCYLIFFMTCLTEDNGNVALAVVLLLIVADIVLICIIRKGRDYTWISLTSIAFTIILIYVCWSANLYAYRHNDVHCETNLTKPKSMEACIGNDYHLCEITNIFMCVFLISVVIIRYLQPYSEKLKRRDHANLIALFLASAADVVDFVEYSQVSKITDKIGVDSIYAITTLSVFQFSMTLTATKTIIPDSKGYKSIIDFFFGTEAWSIILVLLTQDLPYLVLRIIILAKGAGFVVHTLLFFTLKNVFMIVVDLYKLRTLYCEYFEIKRGLHEYKRRRPSITDTLRFILNTKRSKKIQKAAR